jgi:hypothetical protein
VEKGKIYFYKLPGAIPKPAHEWLESILEKINEVTMSEKDKKQIEKWTEQLQESWKNLHK